MPFYLCVGGRATQWQCYAQRLQHLWHHFCELIVVFQAWVAILYYHKLQFDLAGLVASATACCFRNAVMHTIILARLMTFEAIQSVRTIDCETSLTPICSGTTKGGTVPYHGRVSEYNNRLIEIPISLSWVYDAFVVM
jgi:hypothetical protein